MGEKKDLKLQWAESISQAVFGKSFDLAELKKPCFDRIWQMSHDLLELHGEYAEPATCKHCKK